MLTSLSQVQSSSFDCQWDVAVVSAMTRLGFGFAISSPERPVETIRNHSIRHPRVGGGKAGLREAKKVGTGRGSDEKVDALAVCQTRYDYDSDYMRAVSNRSGAERCILTCLDVRGC